MKSGFITTAYPQYRSMAENLVQLISNFSQTIATATAQTSDPYTSYIKTFLALYFLYFLLLKIFDL